MFMSYTSPYLECPLVLDHIYFLVFWLYSFASQLPLIYRFYFTNNIETRGGRPRESIAPWLLYLCGGGFSYLFYHPDSFEASLKGQSEGEEEVKEDERGMRRKKLSKRFE